MSQANLFSLVRRLAIETDNTPNKWIWAIVRGTAGEYETPPSWLAVEFIRELPSDNPLGHAMDDIIDREDLEAANGWPLK